MPQKVYADFQNLDDLNRLRLTCAGTRADLERLKIDLHDGLVLTFYTDDEDDGGRRDDMVVDPMWPDDYFLSTYAIAVKTAGDFPLNPQVAVRDHWAKDPGRQDFLAVQKLAHPEVYIPNIWNISGGAYNVFSAVLSGTSPRQALASNQKLYQTELTRLGKPTRVQLVRRRELGDDRIYLYELTFGDSVYYAQLGLAPDDRVSAFGLRARP